MRSEYVLRVKPLIRKSFVSPAFQLVTESKDEFPFSERIAVLIHKWFVILI